MGNYRFKISDMMPNSWFYKLKNMGRGGGGGGGGRTQKSPNRKKLPRATAAPQAEPHCDSETPKKLQNPHHYHHHNPLSQSRKSYYFAREHLPNSPADQAHCPEPPRKSSRRKPARRSSRRQCPSSGRLGPSSAVVAGGLDCSCGDRHSSVRTLPESPPPPEDAMSPLDSSPETEFGEPARPMFRSDSVLPTESSDGMVSLSWTSSSCSFGGGVNSTPNDIEIDIKSFDSGGYEKGAAENGAIHVVSDVDLPPIVTKKPPIPARNSKKTEAPKKKPSRTNPRNGSDSNAKEQKAGSPGRRISAHSPGGVRLRVNSPRIGGRRFQGHGGGGRRSTSSSAASDLSAAPRRSVSDSFAVVKASVDPGSDFRDSMVEMILQNNIWESKDLEELLACYLSLNSDEYHDIIIAVFKQIWVDLTVARRVKLFQ